MNILWQNEHYPDIVRGGGGARNTRHITKQLAPTKIHIIPNGVDYAHYSQARRSPEVLEEPRKPYPDAVVIVCSGRISRIKRLEFLFRAFAMMKHRSSCVLVLLGDGDERPALEQLARDLAIADGVRFLGNKPDVAPYLAAFDSQSCLMHLTSSREAEQGTSKRR